jgi:hypothetical protein
MLSSQGVRHRDRFGLPSPSLRVFSRAKLIDPALIHPDFLALRGVPLTSLRIGYPSHV